MWEELYLFIECDGVKKVFPLFESTSSNKEIATLHFISVNKNAEIYYFVIESIRPKEIVIC
jgi:hypothetical protein